MTSRIDAESAKGHVGSSDPTIRHFTVHHDGVAIAVSRGGRGRPLVLCPGLGSTQRDLHELIELLRRDHDVVTFDLRGHGRSSGAGSYTFAAFLGDLVAVMAEVRLPAPPVLVGYSLGADLVVHCAAENPETSAGLVLVDGANPLPERFLTEADLPEFRAMWESSAVQQHNGRGEGARLTASEIVDLNLELDAIRTETILDRYRRIACPIHMVMSTSMAGDSADAPTRRRNRNWRAGVDRLVRELPHVGASWLDADHSLAVTHAPEIARIIRRAPAGKVPGD